ncbi:phosphotransferase enzyme family protein [Rhizophagus clarus]|uniref:Altered inheritance of mitochondria protein 9, mitochondrial n=1 Tax=Rhizophagus clarus TaxID=94130 RepID=A0A8H3QQR8_9GLOM|nr:phosphotransferase enzyme family protein [Rhizophagus clarus]
MSKQEEIDDDNSSDSSEFSIELEYSSEGLTKMSKQEEIDDDNSSDSSEFSADLEYNLEVDLEYNLEGLKEIASKIFGKYCISVNKLREGGFHKVFILKMEDDNEYIGRIAFPDYPYWKTESEVAVMKYIRERTSIRVPEVYHYESNKENPVGQEYIYYYGKITWYIIISLGQVIELAFFSGKRFELKNVNLGPFDNIYDYIIAAIEKEIIYNRVHFNEKHHTSL